MSSIGVVRGPSLAETVNGMKHVCVFRHALALDECRVKFLPEYVNQGFSEYDVDGTRKEQTPFSHTKEVWFVGTHSDMCVMIQW